MKNTNNYSHLGTLGTVNHFIEVCVDEVMLDEVEQIAICGGGEMIISWESVREYWL